MLPWTHQSLTYFALFTFITDNSTIAVRTHSSQVINERHGLDVMKGEIIMLYGKYAEVPCRPICFPLAPKPLPHGATIPTVYRSLHGKSLGRDGSGHKQETNIPSELHGRLQDQSNTEVSLPACITGQISQSTESASPCSTQPMRTTSNSNTNPTSTSFTAFADNLLIRSVTDLW